MRPRKIIMLQYLPRYYHEIKVSENIIEQESKEFDDLHEEIQEVLNQFFVNTATWGLKYWEKVLGTHVDETKSDEERRSIIKGKLRGTGTTTVELIQEVAESFEHGDVEVAEYPHIYKVEISFVDRRGTPTDIDDIKEAIKAVIPAHLEVDYLFIYLTWNEFDEENLIWDELDAKEITWDEIETHEFE